MTGKLTDRLVALGVFLVALVVYLFTMAETAPFWDSGEFIASVYGLQVMHPPGAPFYILLGRFFTFFAPLFGGLSPEPVAFSVNLISVLASALTVLLAHLVVVRLARIWKGQPHTWTGTDRLAVNAGAAIGALGFAFTDSFWFNAVEAEVYALSMLFTALVVWLILRWREKTLDEEADLRARGEHPFGLKADRHLLLIAYLFGLAIGVHLLNLLAVFFIALIIFYTKVERDNWTLGQHIVGLLATGVVAALAFFTVYPGVIQWLPSMAEALGSPTLFFILLVAVVVGLVWWTERIGRPVWNLVALSFAVILIGYSTYGVIFVRSEADPPIDLNDPETTEAFVSYLKREQYGSTPLLRGASYDDSRDQIGRFELDPRTGQPLRDANDFPVIDEELLPRRWSPDPSHIAVYRQYGSDLDFFLRYQVGHMYLRYFLWQFAGKRGDHQDAGWTAGLGDVLPARMLTPSERAGYNTYYGLPLLLGLIGLAFHFVRDWRQAFAVLILFLVTGIGIILYLNQPPNQPRERDYSYVASFFAFSLWIGIGATGLLELTAHALRAHVRPLQQTAVFGLAALLFVAVPGLLLAENYDDHDRSGRHLASDFALNMLESTAPGAILFTNGDNDTYPLWYLQYVEGVRPDVRVVNLSLLNTEWYIDQLRTQRSMEAPPVDIDPAAVQRIEGYFDCADSGDDGANCWQYLAWQPGPVTLPPPSGQLTDVMMPAADSAGGLAPMTWTPQGRGSGEARYLLVADWAVLGMIVANAQQGWERPIYFGATIARSSELDLQPFLQDEGLARRVLPFPTGGGPDGRIDPDVSQRRFERYALRNLDNPDVYYDENSRGMADTYRRVLTTAASSFAQQGRTEEARTLLERVEAEVPPEVIPPSFPALLGLAQAYQVLGDTEGVVRSLKPAEAMALDAAARHTTNPTQQSQAEATQYVRYVTSIYLQAGAYKAASNFYNQLATAIDEPGFRISPEELRQQAEGARATEEG